MVLDFETVFLQWQGSGLFTIILPFFLIFTITFAVLQKIKLFGENKKVNVIIALVIGLVSLQSDYIIYSINNFLPNISLVLIVIVMALVLAGILFIGDEEGWPGVTGGLAAFFAVIGIVWALFFDNISQQFILPWWLYISESAKATLLVIGVIVLVIWLVTKETPVERKKRGAESFKIFRK